MKKDPRVYLAQILECAQQIAAYTTDGQKAFLADPKTQDAVIRKFEIIGEAAKRVPEEYRQEHAEIPWRGLATFRDVLIHQYEGVDLSEVWRIVEAELPQLTGAIKAILPPLEQLEKELAGEEGDELHQIG